MCQAQFKGLSGNYSLHSPFQWAAEQQEKRCLCHTSQNQGSVPDWGCPGVRTQPYLSGEAPPQVHGTRASFVGLQPQHHCGGQLVMGSAATGLLLQVQGNKEGQRQEVKIPPKPKWGLAWHTPQATGQVSLSPLLQHSLLQTILSVLIPLIFQSKSS